MTERLPLSLPLLDSLTNYIGTKRMGFSISVLPIRCPKRGKRGRLVSAGSLGDLAWWSYPMANHIDGLK